MEMLLLAMVLGWVVKNGVKDLVHTGASAICAVQGKPAPSWGSKRRMSRPNGAATRYFSQLWNDSWEDALARHNARNARRDVAGPADSGTATRSFLAGNFRGGLRFAHRKWHAAWIRLKIIRNLKKKDRPRPGQDTVPGEVVPNAQDEDRPQDGDRPKPESVPDEDGDEDEPMVQPDPSQRDCRNCTPDRHWHDQYCLLVGDDPWIGTTGQDEDEEPPPCPKCGTTMTTAPNIGDPMSYDGTGIYRCPDCDYKIRRSPETTEATIQEGPTTMTATAVDGIGLDPQIRFCQESEQQYLANAQSNDNDLAISRQFAEAYKQQVTMTDAALGAVPQGVAIKAVAAMTAAMDRAGAAAKDMEEISALYTQAMDKANAAAKDMATAASEFEAYKNLQEGYAAQPDAPDKEFLLAGQ
jgi:hypothetical protein